MAHIHLMTEEVVNWIDQLVPRSDRDSMNTCVKLTEEVSELMHAIYTGDGNVGEECADILVLLLDIAALHDVDLAEAFYTKMDTNKARRWTRVRGALRHEHDS